MHQERSWRWWHSEYRDL